MICDLFITENPSSDPHEASTLLIIPFEVRTLLTDLLEVRTLLSNTFETNILLRMVQSNPEFLQCFHLKLIFYLSLLNVYKVKGIHLKLKLFLVIHTKLGLF